MAILVEFILVNKKHIHKNKYSTKIDAPKTNFHKKNYFLNVTQYIYISFF